MIVATYEINTGVITGILNVPDSKTADLNVSEGYSWVIWDKDLSVVVDYRVSNHALVLKTAQSVTATHTTISADGADKSVLSGMAVGSRADIIYEDETEQRVTIPGSKMNFCTDIVGTHDIVIKHPAWLDTTVTITATAP